MRFRVRSASIFFHFFRPTSRVPPPMCAKVADAVRKFEGILGAVVDWDSGEYGVA